MNHKKMYVWLLLLSLFCGLLPVSAQADEGEAAEEIVQETSAEYAAAEEPENVPEEYPAAPEECTEELPAESPAEIFPEPGVFVNPLYADVVSADSITPSAPTFTTSHSEDAYYAEAPLYDAPFFSDASALTTYLRPLVAAHTEQMLFSYWIEDGNQMKPTILEVMNAIIYTHTGNGKEGDAIRWTYAKYGVNWSYKPENGGYHFDITLSMSFYSSAAQELELDEKVAEILAGLELSGKNDYEKVRAIYDYFLDHVSFDYEHLSDETYMLKFTGYGALCLGKAVCQGYSVAFYRLCLESGIDSRIVTGREINHAWNIVGLDGSYYECDATWDTREQHRYFLRGGVYWRAAHNNGTDYAKLGDDWDDPIFAAAYVVPDWDYTPPGATAYAITYHNVEDIKNTNPPSYNSSEELRLSALYRVGYYFYGWYTDSDFSGQRVDAIPAGSSGEIDLYAFFSPIPYTVRFDGNGADSGSVAKKNTCYDQSLILPDNGFERFGYVFAAWNTAADGSGTDYEAGESVKNLSTGSNVTLYARWEEATGPQAAGNCGEELSWTLDSHGVLSVTGKGSMTDYAAGEAPWSRYSTKIVTVVLHAGVSHVGSNAFGDCTALNLVRYAGTEAAWASLNRGENAFPESIEISCEPCMNGEHSWGEVSYCWSEDHRACTATRVCRNDQTHVDRAEAEITWFLISEATPTQDGTMTAVASFTESWAETQSEDATFPYEPIPGDMNGDNVVDGSDVIALAKYVKAGGRGVSITGKSDVSGNGVTDSGDVVLLARYVKMNGVDITIH